MPLFGKSSNATPPPPGVLWYAVAITVAWIVGLAMLIEGAFDFTKPGMLLWSTVLSTSFLTIWMVVWTHGVVITWVRYSRYHGENPHRESPEDTR